MLRILLVTSVAVGLVLPPPVQNGMAHRVLSHTQLAVTVAEQEVAARQCNLGDPRAKEELEAAVRAAAESERKFAEQLFLRSTEEQRLDADELRVTPRRGPGRPRLAKRTVPKEKSTTKEEIIDDDAARAAAGDAGLRNPMDVVFDSKLLDVAEEQSLGRIAQDLYRIEVIRDALLMQWKDHPDLASFASTTATSENARRKRKRYDPEGERARDRLARTPQFKAAWCAACNCSATALKTRITRGRAARRALVAANMRLVFVLAKRHEGRGVGFSDLIQEGAVGLMAAATKFDPDRGYKFSTYAFHWIRQALLRALACQSRLIRLPMYVHDEVVRLHRTKTKFTAQHAREPTEIELAKCLDLEPAKLRKLIDAAQRAVPLSVDDTVSSANRPTTQTASTSVNIRPEHRGTSPFNSFDDASGSLFYSGTNRRVKQRSSLPLASGAGTAAGEKLLRVSDTLVSPEPSGEAGVDMSLLHSALHRVLKEHLEPHERWVIGRRFGLEDGMRRTHLQIAEEADQPKRWVKAVEASALRKLRHPHPRMVLRAYNEHKEDISLGAQAAT